MRCTRPKAAVEEGVIAGGGVALLHGIRALARLQPNNNDQKVGIDIVRRALQAPARQIVENAGADGAVVIGKLLEKGDANHGYDAQNGIYTDMMKAGIIDPTKVGTAGASGRGFREIPADHHRGDGSRQAREAFRAGNARRCNGRNGLLRPRGAGSSVIFAARREFNRAIRIIIPIS